jgi:4-hydroxy-tetrahydrodipicolinate reductase
MKILMIGDGKMGQAIASLATARGHTITAMLGMADNPGGAGIDAPSLGDPDIAIEFTEPASAVNNALACIRSGLPVVVGTTGWYDHLETVEAEVRRMNGALFWAPNFSIGVAIMSAAVEAATSAMRAFGGDQDIHLTETHHSAKKDMPSGTAAALAALARKHLGRDVGITSIRVGSVPGTHELVIDGRFDQVRIVHEARDRRVFADGAISAAEWMQGKRGVYTMKDVLAGPETMR